MSNHSISNPPHGPSPEDETAWLRAQRLDVIMAFANLADAAVKASDRLAVLSAKTKDPDTKAEIDGITSALNSAIGTHVAQVKRLGLDAQ